MLFLDCKTSHWYEFYPLYHHLHRCYAINAGRVSHPLAHHQFVQDILARLTFFCDCLILITMDRGHYQAVLNTISNPTHKGFENWKMHAIKQIKVFAEYRHILVPQISAFSFGLQLLHHRFGSLHSSVSCEPRVNGVLCIIGVTRFQLSALNRNAIEF